MSKHVRDGYLVAFNHGEFGGSLWWYGADGRSRRRLGDISVRGFVEIELPGRTAVAGVILGFRHMGEETGSLMIVDRDDKGELRLAKLRDLASLPEVVGESTARGSLVVTGTSVVRIDRRGDVRRVASVDLRGLNPQSIVETGDGLIIIGMQRYLLEIDPRKSPVRMSWYTDAACLVFRPVRPASCECK